MLLLPEHRTIQDTHAFFSRCQNQSLKEYAQAPPWIGRADLPSTDCRRKDCSVAAYRRHCSHDIKFRLWGRLPPSSSAPSDLAVWSLLADAVQFWAFCSPRAGSGLQRTHSLSHSITVPSESSVTFSPSVFSQLYAKYLWLATHFLNKHLEMSFEMRFLCIQEFVKITEKNVKCHNGILATYILLTAFGIIMLCIRQECNYEVSLINRRIFLCINLQTLTESEAFIFFQLSP